MVFKVIYWLFLGEAILRCLYFWQLKEYRWDRFREWLKSGEARRYFLPGKHWLRPKLTVKICLLIFLSLILALQPVWWLGYLLVPVLTAAAVGIISPFSELAQGLIILAAWIKLQFFHRRLLVIGITGSYGKTSTKEILAHLLEQKFKVVKTVKTNNTIIAVAKTILLNLPRTSEIFVAEMGAYKTGEISAICRLIRPKIGVLTGVNEQHLGLFGSLGKIVEAKGELLRALPASGLAVVNGGNKLARLAVKGIKARVKYYRAGKYKTNLIGSHQQQNIAAAVTVAKYLGLKQFNLNDIPGFTTAISRFKGLNRATIVNDSYNSNPAGFLAAVRLAKTIPAKKKILISPGIIELGRAAEPVHRHLIAAAKAVFDEVIITKREKISEELLLKKLKADLSADHLLLIEGRFSKKFIEALCRNQS